MVIKIGLIGGGYWGEKYLKTLGLMKDVQVNWIYNKHLLPKGSTLNSKFTRDYKKILKDKETTAVIIATPPLTHYQIAKDALNAGKDVLVEKPMTCSSKRSLELHNLSLKNSQILMVGHIFLYHPAIIELKKRIKKQELGDLFYFHSIRTGGKPRKDIDVMWNLAPHDISTINYLTEKMPSKVSARGKNFLANGVEDVVNMDLTYNSNIKGFIHISQISPEKIRRITLVGSKKSAIFDDCSVKKLKIFENQAAQNFICPKLKKVSPLENQCLHFLNCIQTRAQPLTDGREGYENDLILERAQESLKREEDIQINF